MKQSTFGIVQNTGFLFLDLLELPGTDGRSPKVKPDHVTISFYISNGESVESATYLHYSPSLSLNVGHDSGAVGSIHERFTQCSIMGQRSCNTATHNRGRYMPHTVPLTLLCSTDQVPR